MNLIRTTLSFLSLAAVSLLLIASAASPGQAATVPLSGGMPPLPAVAAEPDPSAAPANRFGILFVGDLRIPIGQSLGVSYERVATSVTVDDGTTTTFKGLRDAGFGVVATYTNTCSPPPLSCPVTDPPLYKTQLGARLDVTFPTLVAIENEEDGVDFSTATPTQYLQELTYAVQVAHGKGYKITNGGITTFGLNIGAWHHLWLTGPCQAADAFAKTAFVGSVVKNRKILDGLPNCSDPNLPILEKHPDLQSKLGRVETLIAGYRATGIDYVNFHWYEGDPVTMGQAVGYLEQATGLPAVCNEMGQYSLSGDTVTGLLRESIALKLPYAIWFASDGVSGSEIGAIGLANQNGTLRINGLAYKSYISLHK